MITESNSLIGKSCGQGRYQVKRKLGEGGMAYVLLAHDNNLDIDVVLKVPKPIILADPEFAHRFKREIRSMVELAHPHILKIKDVGEHEGLPFYVMDLLTGGSLEDRFGTKSDGKKIPMPPESLSNWLADVADALDFIHRRYVHRDVKPANILFDAHGNALVSDFGIAKAISDGSDPMKQTMMTQAGMVLGTGPYMAPEVSLGEKYDGRADQYALAVTVYEVLSGQVPFGGTTLQAIILQQTTKKIPPLNEVVPTLSKDLNQAIVKGLNQDPKKRFADCASFAKAVLLATVQAAPAPEAKRPGRADAGLKAPCPSCNKPCTLPPNPAGKRVTCAACGGTFTVAKRFFEKETPETSRSQAPEARTRVVRRNEAAPTRTQSGGGTSPARTLEHTGNGPPVFSRRVWLGIAITIAFGVIGLFLVGAILSIALLWSGGGTTRRDERPK
jgi:serine/threonine protein kinase